MEKNNIQKELKEIRQILSESADKPMNLSEAAKYLSISKGYLYKLCCWREIVYYKPRGKMNFFKKSDLDDFLYRNKIKSNVQQKSDAENFVRNRK